MLGDGAREEARDEATIALAREEAVSWGVRLVVERMGSLVGFRRPVSYFNLSALLGVFKIDREGGRELFSALPCRVDGGVSPVLYFSCSSISREDTYLGESRPSTAEAYDDDDELPAELLV